jgi:hypothetical protein
MSFTANLPEHNLSRHDLLALDKYYQKECNGHVCLFGLARLSAVAAEGQGISACSKSCSVKSFRNLPADKSSSYGTQPRS